MCCLPVLSVEPRAGRPLGLLLFSSRVPRTVPIALSQKPQLSGTNLGHEKYTFLIVFLEQGSDRLLHRSSQTADLMQCLLTSRCSQWEQFSVSREWGMKRNPITFSKSNLLFCLSPLFYPLLGRSNYMNLLKEKS